ncbi:MULTISPECIES: type I restriction-modification system subunit M N-terminal domain-containing protein [unclassified Acidithiobacillus]|uniref:type I restriction-modification system subunit M N-terminal domain-containing protein n=1 Tax=unclassified Acidithiobacillus TaxID=2614800 RepID=UPI001D0D5208|nr:MULTISPECIES: type I restriction-modification system subunit M N-terminal domain-containing protein [unclassified Acidithiobacillus]
MPRGPAKKKTEDTSSLESKLWATADKLRGHLDAADYKHVVLGLIFLKYISDRFAQRHSEILGDGPGADPEDRDEYTAEGVFWVPASARWPVIQAAAKQTDIGKRIDDVTCSRFVFDTRILDIVVRLPPFAKPNYLCYSLSCLTSTL